MRVAHWTIPALLALALCERVRAREASAVELVLRRLVKKNSIRAAVPGTRGPGIMSSPARSSGKTQSRRFHDGDLAADNDQRHLRRPQPQHESGTRRARTATITSSPSHGNGGYPLSWASLCATQSRIRALEKSSPNSPTSAARFPTQPCSRCPRDTRSGKSRRPAP